MVNKENPDVLICGAGPVGMTLATHLARHEIGFRIIDKGEHRSEFSKALGLFARSMELLHSGMDAHALLTTGIPLHSVLILANKKVLGRMPLHGADSPFGSGVMIPQSETERILEESIHALGMQVERRTELTAFEDLGNRVRCTLRTQHGEETIEPAWLVGCDGAHSTIRHGLDLEFKGEVEIHRWVLADVHVDGIDDVSTIVNCLHRNGVMVLFRIKDNRFRIAATFNMTDQNAPRVDPTLEEMQQLTDERGPGGWRLHDPTWLSEFRVNERMVDQYRVGRVFLAGDAAHIHSPAGGQGMNTGMQDVCNLAWKLALTQRGAQGEQLLDSYNTERNEIGRQLLINTGRMTRFVTIQSRLGQWIRNHIIHFILKRKKIQKRFRLFLTELGIAYPHSPITGQDHRGQRVSSDLHPGDRIPDMPLIGEHGDDSLHDLLTDPRITVLLVTDSSHGLEHVAAVENVIPKAWRDSVHVIRIMSDAPHPTGDFYHAEADALKKRLGLEVGSFAVIRPDGYLALLADATNPTPLAEWLSLLLTADDT